MINSMFSLVNEDGQVIFYTGDEFFVCFLTTCSVIMGTELKSSLHVICFVPRRISHLFIFLAVYFNN